MARLYFHCTNARGAWVDPVGVDLADLGEACWHATRVMRSLIASPTLEDWRGWVMHVCDDHGEEVFLLPFASALGKPS